MKLIIPIILVDQPNFLFSNQNKLKRIHFHRIFLDESHYNQLDEKTKRSLASLSASHRYCLTAAPIGHSLNDLYGQVRNNIIVLVCLQYIHNIFISSNVSLSSLSFDSFVFPNFAGQYFGNRISVSPTANAIMMRYRCSDHSCLI